MSITHVKSATEADFTGTVTVFDSQGSTATIAATDLVRPSDWNSKHQIIFNLSSNTLGSSQVAGTDVILVGGNNITLSADTANSKLVFSGPNTAAQSTNLAAAAAGTQTQTSGTVVFSNSNGISFGMSNSSVITASYTVPSQTNQSAIKGLGASNTGNTAGNTGLSTGIDWVLAGTNNITISQSTAGGGPNTLWISGPTIAAQSTNLAAAAAGTQTQTSGTLVFSNSNGISFGMSNSSVITASYTVPTQTVQPGMGLGVSNTGTTAGNTGTASSGTIVFAASGNITASQSTAAGSNSTIWFSVPAQTNQTAGLYAVGNTTGQSSSSTFDARTISFSGAGIASVGYSGGNVIISVPAGGGGGFTGSWWEPALAGATTVLTMPNGTMFLRPFELDGSYDADKVDMYQSFNSSRTTVSFSASVSAGNASSGTGSWGQTGTLVYFTRVNTNETNASFNSIASQFSTTWSQSAGYSASVSWSTAGSSATASVTTSGAMGFVSNIDSNGAVTTGSTGTSGSTSFSSTSTNANSFSSSFALSFVWSGMSGLRAVYVPGGGTNLPAGEWWLGIAQSTATGSTNMGILMSCASMSDAGRMVFTNISQNYMEFGNSAAFTTSGMRPMYGSYSASSNTTSTLALSQFSSMASNAALYFALDGRTK